MYNTKFPTVKERASNTCRVASDIGHRKWHHKYHSRLKRKINKFKFNIIYRNIYWSRIYGGFEYNKNTTTTGKRALKKNVYQFSIIESHKCPILN